MSPMVVGSSPVAARMIAGRYLLCDEIGAGGMATVQIGRQRGAAGFMRTVAIKRLHPALARNPEFVSSLVDEAHLAARIQHPNVVQTLDVVVEERELFVVMEYIHGESLSDLMRLYADMGMRIPFWIVATMLVDVLHGLHAAHETKDERGRSLDLIHRDVSPQNILVGADGSTRVLDFGIAKSKDSLHISQTGTMRGKFSYISPEEIIDAPLARQVDIYSASVVLWECLTGQRLFRGPNPEVTLAQVLSGNITAPSAVVPELPTAFDAVVLRGLAKRPSERFETAQDMAFELEKCCRLASHRNVAAWLDKEAHVGLNQRAHRVARAERDFSADPKLALRDLLGELASPNLPESTFVAEQPTESLVSSQTSKSKCNVTLPVPSLSSQRKRRSLLSSGCVAVAVTAAVLWLALTHKQTSPNAMTTVTVAPRSASMTGDENSHRAPAASASLEAELSAQTTQPPLPAPSSTTVQPPSVSSGHPSRVIPQDHVSSKRANENITEKPLKASEAYQNLGGRL